MPERVKIKVAIVTALGQLARGGEMERQRRCSVRAKARRCWPLTGTQMRPEETCRIIRDEGGECLSCEAAVANADAVKSLVAQCLSAFGRVDILHNNVGIPEVGGPEEIDEETWDQQFAVNVKSMYLTSRNCLPQMVKQGKRCDRQHFVDRLDSLLRLPVCFL